MLVQRKAGSDANKFFAMKILDKQKVKGTQIIDLGIELFLFDVGCSSEASGAYAKRKENTARCGFPFSGSFGCTF